MFYCIVFLLSIESVVPAHILSSYLLMRFGIGQEMPNLPEHPSSPPVNSWVL